MEGTRGCAPLDSPLRGPSIVAPSPPPYFQEGGPVKESSIWRHILQTSCQRGGAPPSPLGARDTPRPLPTGLRPSGLPAYTRWGAAYSYALNCLLSLIPWLKYDDPRSGP